ncbi:hypothetical protein HGRIS_012636 [Hohenbuehelia grisea]|uniref:F-box domain-containing protein n=1 Tax=Hohenbuehelia grisea TaxID=104357 RepID=A0ABR3ISV8_9AGAR
MDDGKVFGPTEVYMASRSSESLTLSRQSSHSYEGHSATDASDVYQTTPASLEYTIAHEQAQSAAELGIAITTEELSPQWHRAEFYKKCSSFDDSESLSSCSSVAALYQQSEPLHSFQPPIPSSSGINSLPAEVLSQIFIHCSENIDTLPSPTSGPLLVAQVCKRWRQVAITTPLLWSSLSVLMSDFVCLPHISLVKTWITRSASSPLHLSLVYDGSLGYRDGNFGSVQVVSELFIAHSWRWKSVAFNFTHANPFLDIISRIPGNGMPILESVEISLRQRPSSANIVHQSSLLAAFFRCTPSLREVTCRGVCPIMQLKIPWAQLTHVDLEAPLSASECLEILRQGRQLLECRFHMEHSLHHSLDDCPLIVHPLRSLYISSQENLAGFFDHLILPNLDSLGISARWTPARLLPSWPQRHFISFLSRSACPITAFSIRCLSITDAELLECLLYLSDSLSILEVYVLGCQGAIAISDTVLNALTYRDCSVLCPRLQQLTLCGCVTSSDGVLGDMATSRWRASRRVQVEQDPMVLPLQKLDVTFSSRGHLDDAWKLRVMHAEGLLGDVGFE